MIDFQNGGLEHQVYELILKMCDLKCSDDFPKFKTSQLSNGEWECKLSIPGVKTISVGKGPTEVESINKCALNMLFILERDHDKNQFDPDMEDSIFRNNIEEYFSNVDYDNEYGYHLYETDILINIKSKDARDYFAKYVDSLTRKLAKEGEEIDSISDIVTVRFLIKKKKKNYC